MEMSNTINLKTLIERLQELYDENGNIPVFFNHKIEDPRSRLERKMTPIQYAGSLIILDSLAGGSDIIIELRDEPYIFKSINRKFND